MCSHHVLKRFPKFPCCFPKMSHITPQFYPIWFAKSFHSHVYRWVISKHIFFYFTICGQKRCLYWGVLNVPKKWMLIQSSWLLPQKKGACIGEYPMFQKNGCWFNHHDSFPKRKVLILGSTQCSKKIDVHLIIMTPSRKERWFYWGVPNVPKKWMLI